MAITTTIDPNNINNPSKAIFGIDIPSLTTTTTTTTTPNTSLMAFISRMPNPITSAGLSSAGWSDNSRGFKQQTFLGASIRGFSMQGGFGDTTSSLTVDLVVDEYNNSDGTPLGQGDDVYHSGLGDNFIPPIPGCPVFFKFGRNLATVEEAYRKTFDDLYYYNTSVYIEPASAGTATMEQILNASGNFQLGPNQYVDLDSADGAIVTNKSPRPIKDYSAIVNNPLAKGRDHIVFGGVLQTYNQNRTQSGNPLYTAQVLDPREILSNYTLLLNNYAGSIYNQNNLMNVYGFLEYNVTESTKNQIKSVLPFENKLVKNVTTSGPEMGKITLTGDDKYYRTMPPDVSAIETQIDGINNQIKILKQNISIWRVNREFGAAIAAQLQLSSYYITLQQLKSQLTQLKNASYPRFPMTGSGFARRSSQGIPYFRIKDAINALMEYETPLPQEYKDQGFGGRIKFHGFNYVVDFGGLPELPSLYYLDFDQINLLELALEICDITNRELFVSLLPVIDHPACANIYAYNKSASPENIVAGIIRLDAIDKSEQPFYGAVKTYIDNLSLQGVYFESQDLGYELSNVATNKFVVGAQEIELHFFSGNADRDTLAFKKTGQNGVFPNKPLGYQWTLDASLDQQILPYYGKLGHNAVTIPKGFGAYQQILLDSSSLNAAGVGNYYVATEMELRCALVSFDRWKEFLKFYNDTYMDSLESDDFSQATTAGLQAAPLGGNPPVLDISNNYVVSVPRSVFDTYAIPQISGPGALAGSVYGPDGLPISPCNPPYGYPLYYKRMTKIGIPEAGLMDLYTKWRTVLTNYAELESADRKNVKGVINSQYNRLKSIKDSGQQLTEFEQAYLNELERLLNDSSPKAIQDSLALIEDSVKGHSKNVFPLLGSIAKKNTQNAIKVYNFVKAVADECLGKKFLVKIPKEVNLFYNNTVIIDENTKEYFEGPFGFRPRSTKKIPGYEFSQEFRNEIENEKTAMPPSINMIQSFLRSDILPNPQKFAGGLSLNFNPISEKYESNFQPVNVGGYFNFDLYSNTLGASALNNIRQADFNRLPLGVKQGLIPQDLSNFINDDGRILPYVRFAHSEDVSLEGLNEADFTQQYIVGNSMIPDLSEALDNTGPEENISFTNTDQDRNNGLAPRSSQIAFVRCSVDEQLYMPPKIVKRQVQVHGQFVKDIGTKSIPRKIFVPCSGIAGNQFVPGTGVYVDSFSFYKAHFVPLPNPGSTVEILDFDRHNPYSDLPGGQNFNQSLFINTDYDKLDTNNAYALITLPNRISSTKDARLRDGHLQSVSTERFKHLMTMDVVRDLPGFQAPTNPPKAMDARAMIAAIPNVPIDNRIHAWLAMKTALKGLNFSFNSINITAPSPIYPDLVALPLMSTDRSYGPWVSDIDDIGGRTDFIKDENLAPWNYGGYELLNQAGQLQAQFVSSAVLFSERGAFTVPTIPVGNSLGRALMNGGPLVTSINVDFSTGGARTTYQMDVYTTSFGKLQKQKQDEISRMSRERKKLNSERNALIRKGLGKNQNARNFGQELDMLKRGQSPSLDHMGLGMANTLTKIVASVSPEESKDWSSLLGGAFGSTSNSQPGLLETTRYLNNASIQDETMIGKIAQIFPDQFMLAEAVQNSAGVDIADIFAPMSFGYHRNMSYKPVNKIDSHSELYFIDDEDFNDRNNTSRYGDNIIS
jgi:hypothetical protein